MDIQAIQDLGQRDSWLMVLLSSVACIVGASVVFIDLLWPFRQYGTSILERPSFVAPSLSLATGVLLFSSLSTLLPASQKRFEEGKEYLVYLCYFAGAGATVALTRIIRWCAPDAIHACGGGDSKRNHDGTETRMIVPQESQSTIVYNNPSSDDEERTMLTKDNNNTWIIDYGSTENELDHHHHRHDSNASNKQDYFRIGIQTALAICIHKFPEGLIMFVSGQASKKLGLSVCVAMSIHNVIEGFMIALPLYFATKSRTRAFGYAALLGGMSQPMGAALGFLVLRNVSQEEENTLFGIIFAVVSGMMSMISIQSMLPQAMRADPDQRYVPTFFFVGIFLVGLASLLKSV